MTTEQKVSEAEQTLTFDVTVDEQIAEAERLLIAAGYGRTTEGYWSHVDGRVVWLTPVNLDDLLPRLRKEAVREAAPDLLAALEEMTAAVEALYPAHRAAYDAIGHEVMAGAVLAIRAAKGATNADA